MIKTTVAFYSFLSFGLTAHANPYVNCETYTPLPATASFQEAANQVDGDVDCLRINLHSGSKNGDGIKRIAEITTLGKMAAGNPPFPSTAGDAEKALIGKDAATMKFQSLMAAMGISLMELSATYERLGDKSCGEECKDIFAQVDTLTKLGHQTFFLGYGSSAPVSRVQAREKADEFLKILGNDLAAQVNESRVEVLWKGPHHTIVKYLNEHDCVLTVQVLNGVVSTKGTDLDFVCK